MIQLDIKDIDIIINKRLKHSYIVVTKDAKVVIKTPKNDKNFIEKLLKEKLSWIQKHLAKVATRVALNLQDEVLLFGLKISIDHQDALFLKNLLTNVKIDDFKKIGKCYDIFYATKADEYLPSRMEYLSKNMNLKYECIKLKKLKSRWGSCNSKKVITLNTNLLKLTKEQIDYVLVHELAHLLEMNHSKRFYEIIQKYIPNYKIIQKELRLLSL